MTATPNTAALEALLSAHPKCTTCDHWKDSGEWDTPPGFKRCRRAPMSSDVTGWDNASEQIYLLPEHKDTMMSAMDGSTYKADVHTRGDFYCPMHSALAAPVAENDGGV